MSTVDDLRSTLHIRADGAEPIGAGAWNEGVRAKVRAMRRRRRVGAASVVAAVTAVVGGVWLVPLGPGESERPRPAAGVVPPAAMTSLGHTFSWTDSVDGDDGVATYEVPDDRGPLLVTWATAGDDQRVRVRSSWTEGGTYRTGDFADFVLVPAGDEGIVSVRAVEGEAGLAVYELSTPAAGLTDGGFTFREEIAGGRLAGAAFNEPGESTVELTVTPSTGRISVVHLCDGVARRVRVRVESDSGFVSSGGGCTDAGFDVAGGSRYDTRVAAGRPLTLTLSVIEDVGDDGVAVTDDDLRLGVGVYDRQGPVSRIRRAEPPPLIEAAGHRWRLERIVRSSAGEPRVTATVGGDGVTRWVTGLAGGTIDDRVQVVLDGGPGPRFTGGGSRVEVGIVTGPTSVGLRTRGTTSPGLVMAVAVYVQDD